MDDKEKHTHGGDMRTKKTCGQKEHVDNRRIVGDNERGVPGGATKYVRGVTTCLTQGCRSSQDICFGDRQRRDICFGDRQGRDICFGDRQGRDML